MYLYNNNKVRVYAKPNINLIIIFFYKKYLNSNNIHKKYKNKSIKFNSLI